ncbi:MAG: AAA family ATPase, partial [Chitinispirillaceae bacterium]|nr:AAA family ATPase [Chitinispirillaceae bacterium]
MELSDGEVLDITFRNEENGYSVVKVLFKGEHLPVFCVGTMPMISKGNIISVKGEWKNHQKYGKQFYVEHYTVKPPSTEDGIIAFLSSGIIEGIGEKRAKIIVEKFGKETLDIIEKNPDRLYEIPGFGKKTVEKIVEKLKKDKPFQKLILFLSQFDISLSTAQRIYKQYGEEAIEKISSNPYVMCEDIWGIGFIKADKIAQKMGLPHDSYQRIQTGIIHLMRELSEDGHTCFPFMELVEKATLLLNVPQEKVVFSLDNIVNIEILYKEDDWLYLPYLYKAEKIVAKRIVESIKKKKTSKYLDEDIIQWIDEYEKSLPWKLHEAQKKAIYMAISSPSFLLTGGPGTGKTTILKVIVKFFEKERKRVILAAPTGRAAKRMTEATGFEAKTIH